MVTATDLVASSVRRWRMWRSARMRKLQELTMLNTCRSMVSAYWSSSTPRSFTLSENWRLTPATLTLQTWLKSSANSGLWSFPREVSDLKPSSSSNHTWIYSSDCTFGTIVVLEVIFTYLSHSKNYWTELNWTELNWTVVSCPCRRCELNWREDKIVSVLNILRTTENWVHTTDKTVLS